MSYSIISANFWLSNLFYLCINTNGKWILIFNIEKYKIGLYEGQNILI